MTLLAILEIFFSLTIQTTLLIGVAYVLVRRWPEARNNDFCWSAVHVCILLVTAAAFFLPHVRLTTWADLHPEANYPANATALPLAASICAWLWAIGAAGILIAGIAGIIKAVVIVRRSSSNENLRQRVMASVPALASRSREIEIRFTDSRTGAFCWQIHRPMIALPSVVVDFPPAEQAAIVRHELAHLHWQHPLHLFIQRIVEAIYWYHPLVWWASRQAAAAREIRCDLAAVTSRKDAAVYLRSLLRLIELHLKAPTLLPAGLGFLGDASLLSRRANLLVDSFEKPNQPCPRWRPLGAFAVGILAAMLVWLPVNPRASRRSELSPWPEWSARTLEAFGMPVRDYEIDGHRLDGHEHSD
jgi:bla regulator protein blaR1